MNKEQAKEALELMALPRRERRRIMKLNPGMRIPGSSFPLVRERKRTLADVQ